MGMPEGEKEELRMNTVRRSKGIGRAIRVRVFGNPVQKFVTAGSPACGRMMREACARRAPGPSDRAILAWAQFDLAREVMGGYWDVRAA